MIWSHSPQAASGNLPFIESAKEPRLYRVCHTKSAGQEPHLITICPGLQQICNLAVQDPDKLVQTRTLPSVVQFWPHSSAQPQFLCPHLTLVQALL